MAVVSFGHFAGRGRGLWREKRDSCQTGQKPGKSRKFLLTNLTGSIIIIHDVLIKAYEFAGVSAMQLDLRRVFTEEIKELPFSGSLDLSETEIAGSHPFVSPVSYHGTVKPFAGEAQVEAEVSFSFSIPCDRCAEMIHRDYRYHFSHGVVRTLNQEDNDDYIQAEDETIDVDELLRADILLELPTKFLCRPDCKGLCSQCGQNLNQGDCGCNKRRIDPRLEVLQQLIQSSESK